MDGTGWISQKGLYLVILSINKFSYHDFLRWIYSLFLAEDANFRLKLKERGIVDPEFGPGWAYFVNDSAYKAEIKKHKQPVEVRFDPAHES